jgi:predicted RNase H-like HicB family nuclease
LFLVNELNPLGKYRLLYYSDLIKTSTVTAYIEKDRETGYFVGIVPDIPGAHTPAETLDELYINLKDIIELCFEEMTPEERKDLPHFVGIQNIEVAV